MSRTTSLPVSEAVLKWARENAQLSIAEAAAVTQVELTALEELEAGQLRVDGRLLRRLADAYGVSEETLLLPAPPAPAFRLAAFRGRDPRRVRGLDTRRAILQSRSLQVALSELTEDEPELLPRANLGSASLQESPYEVGEQSRASLGVPVRLQKEWASSRPNRDFGHWRRVFQRAGVLVLLRRMDWDDCRGFSLPDGELLPTIVVNSLDRDRARVFTLCHELGHLVLGSPGSCDVSYESERLETERWCNRFAAAFLMPREDVLTELRALKYDGLGDDLWTWYRVGRVASALGVSRFAMALRLRELRITNVIDREPERFYRAERRREPRPQPADLESPRIARTRRRVSEVGAATLEPVIDAHRTGLLNTSELAELLEVRADQVPELILRVREEQASYGA